MQAYGSYATSMGGFYSPVSCFTGLEAWLRTLGEGIVEVIKNVTGVARSVFSRSSVQRPRDEDSSREVLPPIHREDQETLFAGGLFRGRPYKKIDPLRADPREQPLFEDDERFDRGPWRPLPRDYPDRIEPAALDEKEPLADFSDVVLGRGKGVHSDDESTNAYLHYKGEIESQILEGKPISFMQLQVEYLRRARSTYGPPPPAIPDSVAPPKPRPKPLPSPTPVASPLGITKPVQGREELRQPSPTLRSAVPSPRPIPLSTATPLAPIAQSTHVDLSPQSPAGFEPRRPDVAHRILLIDDSKAENLYFLKNPGKVIKDVNDAYLRAIVRYQQEKLQGTQIRFMFDHTDHDIVNRHTDGVITIERKENVSVYLDGQRCIRAIRFVTTIFPVESETEPTVQITLLDSQSAVVES